MIEQVKKMIAGQFEASLAMMHDCISKCPPDAWEGKIANGTFRQIAYHTLFFVDLYLSPHQSAFELGEVHHRGGDEREARLSSGLSQEETLVYLGTCREKMLQTLSSETVASLESASGFSWLPFSRGEVHLYNLRHVQHHTGQLSAYLRRLDQSPQWIRTGWQ